MSKEETTHCSFDTGPVITAPPHSKTRIRPNENMTIPRNSSFLVASCVLGEGGIWGSHTPLGAIRAIGWHYQNQALPRRKAEVHSQGEVRMDPRHPFGTHRAVAELSGIWTCLQARLPRIAKTKQYLSRIAHVEGDRRQGARAASGDNRGASRRGGGKPPIETDLTGSPRAARPVATAHRVFLHGEVGR